MLTLDVEFLLGTCFAAREVPLAMADWPPQIDRLYSALVATWAARGERRDERKALEWFEQLPPPAIKASEVGQRSSPTVYVPPNDSTCTQIHVLPTRRRRQERRFYASIPHDSLTSYSWPDATPDATLFETLQLLARDTAYVGHSSSLVRCFFHQHPCREDARLTRQSTRRIYEGRFAELESAYKIGNRPAPGAAVIESAVSISSVPASVFGEKWYVFADAGGACPDLRSAAIACRAFRTAIMSGFGGMSIPEVISGHTNEGRPSRDPHMAIFPLANVGWKWADGRLMGLAICMPRDVSPAAEDELFEALGTIMKQHGSVRNGEVSLIVSEGAPWRLVRQPDPLGSSLQPERYISTARTWATATPIALDRHPKASSNEEDRKSVV